MRKTWILGALCGLGAVSAPGRAQTLGFEPKEGYAPEADISAQTSWEKSAPGGGRITTALANHGSQSLGIAASAQEIIVRKNFTPPTTADGITFLDFALRPIADATATPLGTIDANGAMLGFLQEAREGSVVAVATPASAPKTTAPAATNAVETGFRFPLDETGAAANWLQVTIRQDAKAKTWDLYLDGRLVLIDQPLNATVPKKAAALIFYASASGSTLVDDLTISRENPLFPDADRDGIPDAVEMVNGTNTYFDDRTADLNADGASNIRNFLAGSSIGTPALSKNAGRKVIYVDGRLGDDRFSGGSSYRVGGAGSSAEGPKATLDAAIRGSSPETAFALLPADKPYLLVERSPGAKDTIYLIPLGDIPIPITTDPKDIQP